MKTVAIIPARGGSKRIPRKNIREFCGKPIVSYSIQAAIDSELFDDVLVSTDDEEIADVSVKYGATVDGLRPQEISDDKTGVVDVLVHELRRLADHKLTPSEVCLIYATAPMIRINDLESSYQVFNASNADFVFSAAEFAAPIFRAFTILSSGRARMFQPEHYRTNSQDLPRAYHDAAQFCWGRAEAFLEPDSVVFSERSIPFVLPANRVADIDTPEDWALAEWLYQAHQSLSSDKNK